MSRIINWYFPFLLAAAVLCGTTLFTPVFNGNTRWLFVLSAFMLALLASFFRPVKKTPVFAGLVLYLSWCLLTTFWSEIPELSIYKVLAAILVAVGFFSLGFAWMLNQKRLQDAWKIFYWLTPAALIIAVSGKAGQGLLEQGHNYYAGLAGNSNFLGWLMAVAMPPLFWKAYDQTISSKQRVPFFLLLGVCAYYLLLSQSRASILLALCTILGFFSATGMSKKISMVIVASVLFCLLLVLVPNLTDLIYTKFILKGSGHDVSQAFEASRGAAFDTSYEKAEEGGLIGGGYGISIGSNPLRYHGGLMSVGYGREKGNSLLAIVEETGVVGLFLVVFLLWRVFVSAFKAYKIAKDTEYKSIVGMFGGLLFGMVIIHSNLEAWWVAPGSAESMFFWGFSGMSYALFLLVISQSARRSI